MLRIAAFVVLVSILAGSVFAQQPVDPGQRYHRLICLVHLNGSGKKGDPIRPEYAPATIDASSRDGIIAWSMQVADDGKTAIVQYVAVNRHAFDVILADKRADVRVFEVGITNKNAIEGELKRFKKNFSLDSLNVVAQ